MFRHSVNIVKTGENVPKFYNLCSIPIFTLFSGNKNMFKLKERRGVLGFIVLFLVKLQPDA
jgi:hypothetical protein